MNKTEFYILESFLLFILIAIVYKYNCIGCLFLCNDFIVYMFDAIYFAFNFIIDFGMEKSCLLQHVLYI